MEEEGETTDDDPSTLGDDVPEEQSKGGEYETKSTKDKPFIPGALVWVTCLSGIFPGILF